MSNLKAVLITISVCAVLFTAGGIAIDHFAFPCTGEIHIGPIVVEETQVTAPPGTTIDKCGALLFDAKLSDDNTSIHVKSWNKCFSSGIDFPVNCKAAIRVKKWSIGIQGMLLAGYNKDFQKFDIMAGGQIFFLRNFRYGSIGAGLIYQQGLFVKQYYAGASILAKFDI
jgi:hypothetical protein